MNDYDEADWEGETDGEVKINGLWVKFNMCDKDPGCYEEMKKEYLGSSRLTRFGGVHQEPWEDVYHFWKKV